MYPKQNIPLTFQLELFFLQKKKTVVKMREKINFGFQLELMPLESISSCVTYDESFRLP